MIWLSQHLCLTFLGGGLRGAAFRLDGATVYICFDDEFMSDLFTMLMEVFMPEVFGALGYN